jgi:hypothetical protein
MPHFPYPTSEQITLALSYEEKWRAIATNTKRIDRSRVTATIQAVYQLLGNDSPILEFADSPYDAILRLKQLIEDRHYAPLNSLSREIQKKLKEGLTLQLTDYPDVRVYPSALKRRPNDELRPQLDHQVHLLLLSEVGARLVQQHQLYVTLRTQSWSYNYCYIAPEQWASDTCYLDWLCNCLSCEHDSKYWKLLEALLTECGWVFPFEGICIVCDHPTRISFDSERRLHAEGKPALEFSDSLSIFAHHGIRLPEQYRAIPPNQWKAEWYFETKDVTVRKALLENLSHGVLTRDWIVQEPYVELKRLLVDKLDVQVQVLTNEQANALESYRQKWRTIALQLAPIDRQKATLAVEQFYATHNSHKPEVIFADGLYQGGRLVKQIRRGQAPIDRRWLYKPYGKYDSYRYYRGDFSNAPLMNKIWNTIGVQLENNLFQELLKTLIVNRSWSLDPSPGWIQPESLTAWCSLFDFCISVLGCAHDVYLWSVLQSVVVECGWFYPCRMTCIVCDRPLKLSVDDQDRLHDEKEAAIIYADGYRLRVHHEMNPKKYFETRH